MRQFHGAWGSLCSLLALAPCTLSAQSTQTCSVTGEILDAEGHAVPDSRIRLRSTSLQGERNLTSDAKGRFAARLLPPGRYAIEVDKPGYQSLSIQERIGIDQNYQPRFTLRKTAAAVVEVIGTPPALDRTDVKTATNYRLDAVDLLPRARNQDSVAALTPGVTGGVGGRTQIRGAMTTGNLYLLDGQNIADNAYQTAGVTIIDDAIEETQVVTGALSAEYGNVDGGVINSITRSGSNTFSGQARYVFSNPSWNAAKPFYDRSLVPNKLDQNRTFSLGGYFLKDRLWFFASYYRTGSSASANLAGDTLAPSAPYVRSTDETRRQAKLTFLINQEQTLVASFLDGVTDSKNRNYAAGDLLALIPQHSTNGLYSLSLRSIWSPSLTTEFRYGRKAQLLNAGSPRADVYPVQNDEDGYTYYNGVFNKNDGGDHRDNRSMSAKGSLFWDAAGSHQTDFGTEYLKQTRVARNEQSPLDDTLLEAGSIPNYATRMISPLNIITFTSSGAAGTNETRSLYVNDKWELGEHLALQLGLRKDWYEAHNDLGQRTVSANGFSPRLGLKFDLLGNATWLFGLSWARYNSGVAEAISNHVSNSGNPKEVDYLYSGPPFNAATGIPLAQASDLTNYARTSANVSFYSNPLLNVRLAPGLHAPHVDEVQASASYSFQCPLLGEGFLRLTAVGKTWHDLFDFRVGDDGTINDEFGAPHFVRVWYNSSLARRSYRDLELDTETRRGPWSAGGNITWARLEGNYEGEGGATPFRGEGLQNFTILNGQAMFDPLLTAPYGPLAGDVAIRMRGTASYTFESRVGQSVLGAVYRFDSGSHYSLTRSIAREGLNPALPAEFGTSASQYFDRQRGQFVEPAQAYLDLSITQKLQVAKVAGTPLFLFVKLLVYNVFNHQQNIGKNTKMNAYRGTNAAETPWVPDKGFGATKSPAYCGEPRSLNLQAGLRF